MAIACDPGTLAAAAKCFSCLRADSLQAAQVYALCTGNGSSCDPQTLRDQAKCIYQCTTQFEKEAIKVWLLATLAGVSPNVTALSDLAKCFIELCLQGIPLTEIDTYLLASANGIGTDPQTIANNTRCLMECLGEYDAVKIYLWATRLGVSVDPQSLINNATCLLCLTLGALQGMQTALLCKLTP